MTTRVYQFGLLPPSHGEDLVRQQLRHAHDYRNDLVAIERGRRHAIRAIDDASEEVREAVAVVRAATKSTRKAALQALSRARKAARAEAADELAHIAELDASIRRDARALTPTFWGSYLDIEARHQQSRAQPLYGDDGVTPNDPAFVRGPRWQDALAPGDSRAHWWLAPGQLGVQLQGGLEVADAMGGQDRRLRLDLGPPQKRGRRYGTLWMRVGSEGREPVWAAWPIKTHRELPVDAVIKWARVSVRPEADRERWTVEITVDVPEREQPAAWTAGRSRVVAAIEWEWSPCDGGIRVARWCDDRGETGEIVLPSRIVEGIRKTSNLRALRDILRNELHERFARAVREERLPLPRYVVESAKTMHLWRSPTRDVALLMRWRRDCTGMERDASSLNTEAYRLLNEWYEGEPHECRGRRCPKRHGERHLYRYESCARGEALRERRELYRVLAARWRDKYGTLLVSDQDLSIAARWGDDSDVRFVAGVSELRTSLRLKFGADAVDAHWRDGATEEEARSWCERTRDAWIAGGARGDGRFAALKGKTANAWAARKRTASEKRAAEETARDPHADAAE